MRHQLLTIAVAMLCFAACSKDDVATPEPQTGIPIKLNVGIDNPTTRAGYSSVDMPTAFKLTVSSQSNREYFYIPYVVKENDEWVAYEDENKSDKVKMLWASKSDDVTVWAYTQNWFSGYYEILPTNQSTADKLKEADVLYMPKTSMSYDENGINVAFRHLMSKLVFTITLGSEYEYTADDLATKITDVKVQGSQVGAECEFDGESDNGVKITSMENPDDITPFCSVVTPYGQEGETITKAAVTYEALVIPQSFQNGELVITFKVDGKTYRWVSAARTLNVNTQYKLNFMVGNNQVRSAAMRSAAWGSDSAVDDIKTTN